MWRSTNVNVDGLQRSSSALITSPSSSSTSDNEHGNVAAARNRWQNSAQFQRDRFASTQHILQDAITDSKISLHIDYRHNSEKGEVPPTKPRPVSMYEQLRSRTNKPDSPSPPPVVVGRAESFYYLKNNHSNNNYISHNSNAIKSLPSQVHNTAAAATETAALAKPNRNIHSLRQSPSELVCIAIIFRFIKFLHHCTRI